MYCFANKLKIKNLFIKFFDFFFQTLALVGYIVEESLLFAAEDESQCHENAIDKMESRLPLLLQCTSGEQEMAPVAKHLVGVMSSEQG